MKKTIKIALVMSLMSLSSAVLADTDGLNSQANIQANAQLAGTCVLRANNVSLSFTPEATTNILKKLVLVYMTCSNGLHYNIALSAGSSGDTSARTMKSDSGDIINYRIFGQAGLSYPLNTNPSNSTTFTNQDWVGQGNETSMKLWVQTAMNQFVSPGDYSDSLTYTITY